MTRADPRVAGKEGPPASPAVRPLLTVRRLHLEAAGRTVLRDVSFEVGPGQAMAVLGESGAGKSLLLRSILGLLPAGVHIRGGDVVVDGVEVPLTGMLQRISRQAPRTAVGGIGWIGQEARQCLDPTRTLEAHLSSRASAGRSDGCPPRGEPLAALLRSVGLPRSTLELTSAEMSGGMARRAVVAWALAGGARLILADEPANGLDPLARADLARLLLRLQERGLGVVLVTHDVRLAANVANRVIMLHRGKVVDAGDTENLFSRPGSDDLRSLLECAGRFRAKGLRCWANSSLPRGADQDLVRASRPPVGARRRRAVDRGTRRHGWESGSGSGTATGGPWAKGDGIRLRLEGVYKRFDRREAPAVAGLSWDIEPGVRVGILGESGVGKTTLARIAAGLLEPDEGTVCVNGRDLWKMGAGPRWRHRRSIQFIVQEPGASMHPRLTVEQALRESAASHGGSPPDRQKQERVVREALEQGELEQRADAYPWELSGGELRRVGIVRALMARPEVLIMDEPTAGLDFRLKAAVVRLLLECCPAHTAQVWISHDLDVLRCACDEILVLHEGNWVDRLESESMGTAHAMHHVSRELLAAWEGLK